MVLENRDEEMGDMMVVLHEGIVPHWTPGCIWRYLTISPPGTIFVSNVREGSGRIAMLKL